MILYRPFTAYFADPPHFEVVHCSIYIMFQQSEECQAICYR